MFCAHFKIRLALLNQIIVPLVFKKKSDTAPAKPQNQQAEKATVGVTLLPIPHATIRQGIVGQATSTTYTSPSRTILPTLTLKLKGGYHYAR